MIKKSQSEKELLKKLKEAYKKKKEVPKEDWDEIIPHPKEIILQGPKRITTGILDNEIPLPDVCPVRMNHKYVIDDEGGTIIVSEINGTVAQMKAKLRHKGFKALNIRNCNIKERNIL